MLVFMCQDENKTLDPDLVLLWGPLAAPRQHLD